MNHKRGLSMIHVKPLMIWVAGLRTQKWVQRLTMLVNSKPKKVATTKAFTAGILKNGA